MWFGLVQVKREREREREKEREEKRILCFYKFHNFTFSSVQNFYFYWTSVISQKMICFLYNIIIVTGKILFPFKFSVFFLPFLCAYSTDIPLSFPLAPTVTVSAKPSLPHTHTHTHKITHWQSYTHTHLHAHIHIHTHTQSLLKLLYDF